MNSLENMKVRINYAGGSNQVSRMNADKLRSLKKALIYSYQSATAQLSDGRQFRCLINPDKLKEDYDTRIISIPFEDICLNPESSTTKKTTDGIETIGMKAGDVFTWVENNTDWIVYLQRLEETAYFRAEIRKCQYEIDVDGKKYKVYASGPSEDSLTWNTKANIVWNDNDYSLEMYITKDEWTEQYFHRFGTIKLNNLPWQIQAIDNMSLEGVIIVALKEDFKNTIKDKIEEEENNQENEETSESPATYIEGESLIYPYEVREYSIVNATGGSWAVSNTKAQILSQTDTKVKIETPNGRSGKFTLSYVREGMDDIVLDITIDSL